MKDRVEIKNVLESEKKQYLEHKNGNQEVDQTQVGWIEALSWVVENNGIKAEHDVFSIYTEEKNKYIGNEEGNQAVDQKNLGWMEGLEWVLGIS